MQDWKSWWKVVLNWPTQFPIRTVTPLRVAIAEPRVISVLYKAAWALDKNIGDDAILKEVLNDAGFNGEGLLKKAQEDQIKNKLKENNNRALAEGVCGVPSFQIDGGDVIWGQDRMDVVSDLLCGWKCPPLQVVSTGTSKSKL